VIFPTSTIRKETVRGPTLSADMNHQISRSASRGDIKSGSTPATHLLHELRRSMNTLDAPAIFTPGRRLLDRLRTAWGPFNANERPRLRAPINSFFSTPYSFVTQAQAGIAGPNVENRADAGGVTHGHPEHPGVVTTTLLRPRRPDPSGVPARNQGTSSVLPLHPSPRPREAGGGDLVFQADPGWDARMFPPTRAPHSSNTTASSRL